MTAFLDFLASESSSRITSYIEVISIVGDHSVYIEITVADLDIVLSKLPNVHTLRLVDARIPACCGVPTFTGTSNPPRPLQELQLNTVRFDLSHEVDPEIHTSPIHLAPRSFIAFMNMFGAVKKLEMSLVKVRRGQDRRFGRPRFSPSTLATFGKEISGALHIEQLGIGTSEALIMEILQGSRSLDALRHLVVRRVRGYIDRLLEVVGPHLDILQCSYVDDTSNPVRYSIS